MSFSALVSTTCNSPKQSSRFDAVIDTFLVHHMASTWGEDATRMMCSPGGRTVSANYTILSDGSIHGVVPEEARAWTSGSSTDGGKGAAWDRRSITVEIENSSGEPNWNISPAALQAAADLLSDLRSRYNIQNVLGHRDLWQNWGASYPTYCPGPETVAQILALAPTAGGGGGGTVPNPDTPQSEEDDDMRLIKNIDTGRIYAIAPEYIQHLDAPDGEHRAWNDAGFPGYTPLANWSFDRIISAYGIPEGVIDGRGFVRNDLEGKGHEKFGSWSRAQKAEREAWLAANG